VPAERLDETLAAAHSRTDKENVIREKLKAGRTSVEVLGLAHLLQGEPR
jgi:regulator of RNase E activity RraA